MWEQSSGVSNFTADAVNLLHWKRQPTKCLLSKIPSSTLSLSLVFLCSCGGDMTNHATAISHSDTVTSVLREWGKTSQTSLSFNKFRLSSSYKVWRLTWGDTRCLSVARVSSRDVIGVVHRRVSFFSKFCVDLLFPKVTQGSRHKWILMTLLVASFAAFWNFKNWKCDFACWDQTVFFACQQVASSLDLRIRRLSSAETLITVSCLFLDLLSCFCPIER